MSWFGSGRERESRVVWAKTTASSPTGAVLKRGGVAGTKVAKSQGASVPPQYRGKVEPTRQLLLKLRTLSQEACSVWLQCLRSTAVLFVPESYQSIQNPETVCLLHSHPTPELILYLRSRESGAFYKIDYNPILPTEPWKLLYK